MSADTLRRVGERPATAWERLGEMSAGEKLKSESGREQGADQARRPVGNVPDNEHPVPLFLRDRSDGRKGDAQDEKDGVGE